MRKLLSLAAVAALVCAARLSSVQAQEEPSVRIARLVHQLGSDSFSERKQADEELAKFGVESRRELELAAQSPNAEVRLRAADLLRRQKLKDLWLPGHVQIHVKQEPAENVLNAFMEQTGNHLLRGDSYGTFHEAKVDLDLAQGNFWPALDELCRQSENHVRPHFDAREPGLVMISGAMGKNPVAYAGPLRAQIASARKVYIEELDYDEQKSDITHTFQMNLQMLWEDRFQLVAYRSQPEIVEAVTDTKATLLSAQSSGDSWNVAGGNMRQLTSALRLSPPPAAAKKLDRLVLKWGLIAVGDLAAIDVNDLTSHEAHCQDDVELRVEELEDRSNGRYELCVMISRELPIPDPQEILFQENRLELFDDKGRALKQQGQSNVLTDRGARMRVTFAAENGEDKPKVLRLTYPRLRSEKDVEIVFRDVPLPCAKPD
ncbi:MAG TPA: hypothetical protein VFE24_13060 [Pirellulales bacterium]|jgi:hypothetical protein|nr:hypothetical protein [Pirellulales bacterium]